MGTRTGMTFCRGDEKLKAERREVRDRWEPQISTGRRLWASLKGQFMVVTELHTPWLQTAEIQIPLTGYVNLGKLTLPLCSLTYKMDIVTVLFLGLC